MTIYNLAPTYGMQAKNRISVLAKYVELLRFTTAKPHIRELLVECGYSADNVTAKAKRKKVKQAEVVSGKNRQIAELKVKNTKLE